MGPHPGYLGGLLAEQLVLLRAPNLVAFVTNIRAFPQGVLFVVDIEESTDEILGGPDPQIVVEFSDGRSFRHDLDSYGDGLLHSRASEWSGRDGGASWRKEFWLPSLPPPGPVTFTVTLGQSERWNGSASLEGRRLADAAKRALDLWK